MCTNKTKQHTEPSSENCEHFFGTNNYEKPYSQADVRLAWQAKPPAETSVRYEPELRTRNDRLYGVQTP